MRIPNSTDRRVRRTRRALRDALLELTLERGWDEVNVLDVCERADVARSTFYTHFADKEELLLSGFDDLRAALRATTGQAGRDASTVLGFLTRGRMRSSFGLSSASAPARSPRRASVSSSSILYARTCSRPSRRIPRWRQQRAT